MILRMGTFSSIIIIGAVGVVVGVVDGGGVVWVTERMLSRLVF